MASPLPSLLAGCVPAHRIRDPVEAVGDVMPKVLAEAPMKAFEGVRDPEHPAHRSYVARLR